MFKYAKPTIPLGLLHDIEELEPGGSYDQANGGQWKPMISDVIKIKRSQVFYSRPLFEYANQILR